MRRAHLRIALALVTVVAAAVAIPAAISLAGADDAHSLASVTKNATAKYHDLGTAEADGYGLFKDAAGVACIDNQPVGGMGVHYVKLSYVLHDVNGQTVPDTNLDAQHPEALVYAPNGAGELKLAALEYIVFADAWNAEHSDPPSMFGQSFNFTPSPNRFGIPAYYSLHAWVWNANTSGLLKPWNPRVQCLTRRGGGRATPPALRSS
jgi:hypothetical protein